ncbi:pseudouridine synthase [Buchnera aphidicola]|uniref:pseudouridine synthase n=1 Tax=Buchnera aphidicola TaxID=9 RepID=UPI0031B7FBA1
MNNTKIQKILSILGCGSRRYIESQIHLGFIYINNIQVEIGARYNISDIQKIVIKGKNILFKNQNRIFSKNIKILKYHKPIGEICTFKDPYKRFIVFRNLPFKQFERWIMIGRLDINTSGLLLFTNFGEIAYRLMHPKYAIEREYLVCVQGKILQKKIDILKKGIFLKNVFCFFKTVIDLGQSKNKRWFKIILLKGHNHEIRRLWNYVHIKVCILKRIRYGNITLSSDLSQKNFKFCKKTEIKKLCNLIHFF